MLSANRRLLSLLWILVLLAPSAPSAKACTDCDNLQSTLGASGEATSAPDYIILMGDIQPGWLCARWGDSHNDAEDQACGLAQILRADEVLRRAWASYPSAGAVILLGDLVDGSQGGSAVWESRLMGAWMESLPQEIQDVTEWVLGNHDAGSTNCGDLPRSFHNPFDLDPPWPTPITWSRELNHTHIFGIHSALVTYATALACHAQDDPLKYTYLPFSPATCFGDETANPSGTRHFGELCSDASECASGQCGIWEDYYEGQIAHAEESIAACIADPQAKACVMASHFALCEHGLPGCPNDPNSPQDRFAKIQNLRQCSDNGKYCELDYTDGTPSLTRCDGVGATCDVDRVGFESRDRLLAAVSSIGGSKTFVQASGHVGGSSPTSDTGSEILGVNFITAEIPGPGSREWSRVHDHALVIRVDAENGARIVERLMATNHAPVLDPIGDRVASSSSQDFVISGSDPDYGNLNYVLGGSEHPCIALNQGKSIGDGGDLTATLELRSCAPGTYSDITITITDGSLKDAVRASAGAPYYGGTLHPFSEFSLQASETFEITVPFTSGLHPPLDSDGDGVPDAYESTHGMSAAVPDAEGDLDADQVSNGDEYRAATDGRAAADLPPGPPQTPYVLIRDLFDDGVLADRWALGLEAPPGRIALEEADGKLTLELEAWGDGSCSSAVLVGAPSVDSAGAVLRMQLELPESGDLCVGLIAGIDDANRVELCWLDDATDQHTASVRSVRAGAVEATAGALARPSGAATSLRLEKAGSEYRASVDGLPLASLTSSVLGDEKLRVMLRSEICTQSDGPLALALRELMLLRDSDRDGLADLEEDPNADAELGPGETDPGDPDSDDDTVEDGEDNCRLFANDQSDRDGDSIGDACECGDASDDGYLSWIDAQLIQRCAVHQIACPDLCDVTGEGVCNSMDARMIHRFALGQLEKTHLACSERPRQEASP